MNPDDPLGLITSPKQNAVDPLGLLTSKPHLPTKLELAKRNATQPHPEDTEGEVPGTGTKVLGVLAALNRDIPGAEAAQAGIRSVVRGQSYADARNDIRGAEDAAPLAGTVPARLLGGGLAALAGGRALGLGVKGAGALYGGLSGLGDSEPMSKDDRVGNTLAGAAIGGLAGYAGQKAVGIGGRIVRPVARGLTSVAREAMGSAPAIAKTLEGITLPPEVLRPPNAAAAKLIAQSQKAAFANRLQSVLAAVKAQNKAQGIHEVGNLWGDAEEAQGLAPHQQPDLESLLRQSLKMKPRAPQ